MVYITAGSTAGQDAVVAAGGVAAVVAGMQAHLDEVKVQKLGLGALVNITDMNAEGSAAVIAAVGVATIKASMRAHVGEVQQLGDWALAHIRECGYPTDSGSDGCGSDGGGVGWFVGADGGDGGSSGDDGGTNLFGHLLPSGSASSSAASTQKPAMPFKLFIPNSHSFPTLHYCSKCDSVFQDALSLAQHKMPMHAKVGSSAADMPLSSLSDRGCGSDGGSGDVTGSGGRGSGRGSGADGGSSGSGSNDGGDGGSCSSGDGSGAVAGGGGCSSGAEDVGEVGAAEIGAVEDACADVPLDMKFAEGFFELTDDDEYLLGRLSDRLWQEGSQLADLPSADSAEYGAEVGAVEDARDDVRPDASVAGLRQWCWHWQRCRQRRSAS